MSKEFESSKRAISNWWPGICAVALVLLSAAPVSAADYYVGPNGADSNSGSQGEPFASINHGIDQLSPGDTLFLKDGTYHEYVKIHGDDSGTSENPVTIQAVNDGEVTVSGEGLRNAMIILGDHVVVEGIVFKWANSNVITVAGNHNVLRRISAYYGDFDAGRDYQNALNLVGKHNLVVDAAGAGATSHVFSSWSGTSADMHNTFRRVFSWGGDLDNYPPGRATSEFNFYGVSESTMENCIGWGGTEAKSASVHSNAYGFQRKDNSSVNNAVLGSIFLRSQQEGLTFGYKHDAYDNLFKDIVVANNGRSGVRIWGGTGQTGNTLRDVTAFENDSYGIELVAKHPNREVDQQTEIINALLTGNGDGGFGGFEPSATSATYSNSWGNGGANYNSLRDKGCISKDPKLPDDKIPLAIPSDSPCTSAGESGTTIGAEIRYRYVDRKKTDQPLWPWPMQERIEHELGVDVTGELAPDMAGARVRATADPTSGLPPLDVQFEASISGVDNVSSVDWQFGDGEEKTGESVSHTYTDAGDYTATVELETGDGETRSDTVDISVLDVSTLRAVRADQSPTVDGRRNESAYDRATATTIEGTRDNRTDIHGLWTDEGLTLAYEVADADLEHSSENQPWLNDGVEAGLDPDHDRSDQLQGDERKWMVEMDGSIRTGAKNDGGTNWSSTTPADGVETAVTEQDDGYRVELHIPWEALGQTPADGDRMGLLLVNNDRDDGETIHELGNEETDVVAPSTWGVLELVDNENTPSGGDAGMGMETDAGTQDVGVDDTGDSESDAGGSADTGVPASPDGGGCGCRSTSPRSPAGLPLALLAVVVWLRRRC